MALPSYDRILAVYQGQTPDVVPYMLDLSHWFYEKNKVPWDLSRRYENLDTPLVDYHKKHGLGFYLPVHTTFIEAHYPQDVQASVEKSEDGREIIWKYHTPLGSIQRTRRWEDHTYSWGIAEWGVKTEQELNILAYALANRSYTADWNPYQQWVDYVGQDGLIYLNSSYSAMGTILNQWMGVEATVYAAHDYPQAMGRLVNQVNKNNLERIDLLSQSPAQVIIMGDNFSVDTQPPSFFNQWSRSFYVEAIRRLHAAGKYVAVHIDGMLRGGLAMLRDVGFDCADAVTPAPTGDITPQQCREEAGPDFILSGGIAPTVWLAGVSTRQFKQAVISWVELKKHSPRLIVAAGDQVPPQAVEERILIARDLVEKYGRY